MFKIGLEKEYFCLNREGAPTIVPHGVPVDECGWLIEARGLPQYDVEDAVFSLAADEYKTLQAAEKAGVQSLEVPYLEISPSIRRKAARNYVKGLTSYQNLYGHEAHPVDYPYATAGIHISFTNPEEVSLKDGSKRVVNRIFDFAKLFRTLDQVFEKEIVESHRSPGFYELKPDGRIEHRSLPNNVPGEKLIEGIKQALNIFHKN